MSTNSQSTPFVTNISLRLEDPGRVQVVADQVHVIRPGFTHQGRRMEDLVLQDLVIWDSSRPDCFDAFWDLADMAEATIFHIPMKDFMDLTLSLRKKGLDYDCFGNAFKKLLFHRYFKYDGKYYSFGADYSLIEETEKQVENTCKFAFNQEKALYSPGVDFDKSFLDVIAPKSIIYVDGRKTLSPAWASGVDGIYAEIPTMPRCTLRSMSVPQPSQQVLDCCEKMAGFLFHHMCASDAETFTVVSNFFLATMLGIKLDIMIFLYGPKGTGKSTFINILRHLVGPHLFAQTTPKQFCNTGYVRGKTLIVMHESKNPKGDVLEALKTRVGDPLMTHNGVAFECLANFILSSNEENCNEVLDDRRCFSIYLNKKTTTDESTCIKNFLGLLRTNPEVASVFYDQLSQYTQNTIGEFVEGAQTWLRIHSIDLQRRGSCCEERPTADSENLFSLNNEVDFVTHELIKYIRKNAPPNSTKKIPLPDHRKNRLGEDILDFVRSLDISVTQSAGSYFVVPIQVEAAILRSSYRQMKAGNERAQASKAELKAEVARLETQVDRLELEAQAAQLENDPESWQALAHPRRVKNDSQDDDDANDLYFI